jgi:hypothetical protein
MKKVILLAMLFCGNTLFAQDYCKQIKKEVTDNNQSFNYETPYSEDAPPAIRAVRNYSTNSDIEFDNFNLIFFIPCEFGDFLVKGADGSETEKDETGLMIEFDDKSKVKADTIMVTHDRRESGSAARIAYFPITKENLAAFTTKKITKFSLAKGEATVAADMATGIQQYLLCLKAVRKMP